MVADRPLHSNHPSLPAACLPINIIPIRTQSTPGSHEAAVALICGGFDLTLCCVALHIEHNLQFQFLEVKMRFVLSAIESWLCATSFFLVMLMLLCKGSLNISNEV